MSVSGITSGSAVSASYTPPPTQLQQAKPPQKAPSADSLTISKQAQQLATDGDTQAQEIKESGAEKSSETTRGKA